jgi:hypothetical protein
MLLTRTTFETRQIPNMTAHTDRMPNPTNMPTMIRMIFNALLPPPVGAGCTVAAAGSPYAAGGVYAGGAGAEATAPKGAPHFVQNCVSSVAAVPHFVQKLAIVVALSEI